MTTARHPFARHVGSAVLIASLIVLYVAQEVLIPLTMAALFAVMLMPAVAFLVRHRIPDIPAVLAVVGLTTAAMGFSGWLIIGQVNNLAMHAPEYRENLRHRLSDLRTHGKGVSAVAATMQDLKADLASGSPSASLDPVTESGRVPKKALLVTVDDRQTLTLADAVTLGFSSLRPVGVAILTILLAAFMIVQRADMHRRFVALTTRMAVRGLPTLSQKALDEVVGRITHYVVLQSFFNLAAGTTIAGALFLIGLPNALLWGLLTAALRFVPYVGIFLVSLMATVFAVAVSPDWSMPLLVVSAFFAMEILIGNVAEPIFFAQGTGLSTLAVLIATAFWTWIWGPAGLVLAIPLTVCVVAVGKYVPSLNYLYIVLAKDPHDGAVDSE